MMQLIKNLSEPKNLLIVCVLYTGIITVFLLVPISTGISTKLPIDKLVHIVINAALIFLWLSYFYKKEILKEWKGLGIVFFLTVIYGIIIEICQEHLTTSRSADMFDVMANIIGCLSGLLVFNFLKTKYSS